MFFEFERRLDSKQGEKILINLEQIARITRESKTAFGGPTAEWTRLFLAGGGNEDYVEIDNAYDSVKAILEQNGVLGKAPS